MAKEEEELALTLRALLLAALHPLELDSQVDILAKAGWGNVEIGKITGLGPGAVGMRKLRNRTAKRK
jgi:hypothetical protein